DQEPFGAWNVVLDGHRIRLEVREDGVNNTVIVVEDREQPLFVEGWAWVRDPAPDELSNRQVLAVRDAHEGVLVVQGGDGGAGPQRPDVSALPLDQARHRELQVMRDV